MPGPRAPLVAQGGYDVGEDVRDLLAHRKKNHDDDDRHQDQDERVLDHALAALAGACVSAHVLLVTSSL